MMLSGDQNAERPSIQDDKNKVSTLVIAVNLIEPDPDQPRKNFDQEQLAKLAAGIIKDGQLQPIGVRPHPDPAKQALGMYMIVFGERRWRAHLFAGRTEIRAELRSGLSTMEIRVHQYRENHDRDDLNLIEEAEFLDKMLQDFFGDGEPKPQERMADALNMQPSTLSRKLSVLRYSAPVRQLVRDGVITQVNALAKLNKLTPSEQSELDKHARQVVQAGGKFDVTTFLKDPQKYLKQVRGESLPPADEAGREAKQSKAPAPFKATWRLGRAELVRLADVAGLQNMRAELEGADEAALAGLADQLKQTLFPADPPVED